MNNDEFVIYFSVPSHPTTPFLQIPVTDVAIFTSKPFKWIQYVASVIMGAMGELTTLDMISLNLEDPQPHFRHLLFTPTSAIRFIDPHGLNHIRSSQYTTESRLGFRNDIIARDEECVISGLPAMYCDAIHLIPHSKGSQYIQKLCCYRTGSDSPAIESITDIRNGICANVLLHRCFTVGDMAMLRTPNFAMSREDVLPPPITAQENKPFYFTPHYFISEAKSNVRNWFSRDCSYPPVDGEQAWPMDWPPPFLWDFIYGNVVSHQYGIQGAIDHLTQECHHEYYPQGIKAATQKAETEIVKRQSEHDKKVKKDNKARDNTAAGRGQGQLMDSYDKVLGCWMYHRLGPLGQKNDAEDEVELRKLENERQQLKATEIINWQHGVTQAEAGFPLEQNLRPDLPHHPSTAS